MASEKKFSTTIRICDRNKDLSKRWFIFWTDSGKVIKKYKGINEGTTVATRLKAAKELKAYWEQKLIDDVAGISGTAYHRQYKRIQRFIKKKSNVWRKTTANQMKSRMNIFLKWNECSVITKERIEDFLDSLFLKGKKHNTVAGYYLVLRNVLGNALGNKIMDGISVQKKSGTPARYFSSAQVRFLSKKMQSEDPELWLGVQFIFYCFIRPNELRLLKVSDVLLEDKKICIPADVSKNRKTQYVIIPEVFLDELYNTFLGRNPAEYILGGDFKPVGREWLRGRHQKLLRTVHFDTKAFKLYSWKHTGAVMAVKNGVHIKQLQLQLRHHSLDQVNAYLRQMGIFDMGDFSSKMPKI